MGEKGGVGEREKTERWSVREGEEASGERANSVYEYRGKGEKAGGELVECV